MQNFKFDFLKTPSKTNLVIITRLGLALAMFLEFHLAFPNPRLMLPPYFSQTIKAS